MVSFICDACGQTVKKNRVEKHYQTECPRCSVLSCIDCGRDFHGDAYAEHTSCISEAEKYQGKLYKPKEKANKGDAKQQEWIKKVQGAGGSVKNPKLRGYLNRIQEYSNVPQKRAKFINFCKNSLKLHDSVILEQLWDTFNPKKDPQENGVQANDISSAISDGIQSGSMKKDTETSSSTPNESSIEVKNSAIKTKKRKINSDITTDDCNSKGQNIKDSIEQHKSKKKRKKSNENGNVDEDQEISTDGIIVKFSWQKAIKTLLKDAGEDGISLKKLRKKVISEYRIKGAKNELSMDEYNALFRRKLTGYRKAKLVKERVFYVKK